MRKSDKNALEGRCSQGLAKQKQQAKQSDATTEKDKAAPSTKQTETSSTPATLSQSSRAWFIHSVAMLG